MRHWYYILKCKVWIINVRKKSILFHVLLYQLHQSQIFIGRANAEAEAPILWPPDVKNWLIRKDPDAGKEWRQGEKGTIEDKMVGWYHQLSGPEFEQAPGVGDGQGGLACCCAWSGRVGSKWRKLNWCVCYYCHAVVYIPVFSTRCKLLCIPGVSTKMLKYSLKWTWFML